MNGGRWLARLKNRDAPALHPTEPTNPGFVGFVGPESGEQPKAQRIEHAGFVGFVGADPGAGEKSSGRLAAANHSAWDGCEGFSPAAGDPTLGQISQRVHVPAQDDDAFAVRVRRFTERGLGPADAEALADRLARRDADCDDRRMCLECSYLGAQGRCIAAATGRIPGAARTLQPVQTLLQRCDAFGLRKGLI